MEIVEYQPDHLPELTALYNTLTKSVPHCYPIYPEELAGAFAGQCSYESSGNRLTRDTVYVAIDQAVIGFVHVGEGHLDKGDHSAAQGVIRFLAYPRGRRDVGQALLTQAEARLRSYNLTSVLVYPQAYRYPFYHFSHAYLSNHLEHIQALLLCNGYQICGGEVFLDWPDMNPGSPKYNSGLDINLNTIHQPGKGRLPDLTVKAYHKGQEIGECISTSAGTFSKRDVVEDWIFTQWLGISEPFQGKGLGSYLLESALTESCKVGYRHAAISTALDNHRALLFYANCGYHAVDWTRQFTATLK